jgi:hypothetical protein
MENLLLDMRDRREFADALLGHLAGFHVSVSQQIFDAVANVIGLFFIGNDFGSQIGPLISAATSRRFLVPHLEGLTRLGHDYGEGHDAPPRQLRAAHSSHDRS